MRLKKLKLAGFKSFVDPTIISFPSQLAAIVGPNGCGKSNIIDAVRWVMGERSAKNLRGESMTDVIFNGSSQRKPVGQASVELIFDNNFGGLTGQFASYQEIAIKRLVTRDGESTYFLNGTRCRQRDVADIFLGTGVGYSIIGQGTISRIVEARPEELRIYLEEVAGVSKYKKRRRETILRIDHTRENLIRVADIRDELDKQLKRLERQAKAAKDFKRLKQEERIYKAEILALKWQSLTREQQQKQTELKSLLLEYEKHQANLAEAYQQSTVIREQFHEDNESFQQLQAKYYQLATEIARLEEMIHQHHREKERLKWDQQQMQLDCQQTKQKLQQDQKAIKDSEVLLVNLQKNLKFRQEEFNLKQQALHESQAAQSSCNTKLQLVQTILTKSLHEMQLEQMRLKHLNERRHQILFRLEKIHEELKMIEVNDDTIELKLKENSLKKVVQAEESQYQQLLEAGHRLREKLSETQKSVHQTQDKVHCLNTEQASLLAAQQMALGREVNSTAKFARWVDKPRLVEMIEVEKEWQFACEIVLAESLQAIVLESLEDIWPEIKELQGSSMLFLTAKRGRKGKMHLPHLVDKISGYKPNWIHCLDKVYTALSLEEAISCLSILDADESVITAEGYWLGQGWIKIAEKKVQDEQSVLLRQEEITRLKGDLTLAQNELTALKDLRDRLNSQVIENEQQLETIKQRLSANKDNWRACLAEISHQATLLQQAQSRKNTLVNEVQELQNDLQELVRQQEHTEEVLIKVTQDVEKYQQEQQQGVAENAALEEALQNCSSVLEEARTALHESQLQVDREKLKIQQLRNNCNYEQLRSETLEKRMEVLAAHLQELEKPDLTPSESLNDKIMEQCRLENELNSRRDLLTNQAQELKTMELAAKIEEKHAKTIQERIQQEQMQEQALAGRAGGILEILAELGDKVENLLSAIPTGVNQDLREQQLQDIGFKIKQLGAINLAAIEEYEIEFQRKYHLDEQYDDLMEALATLNAAIKKMDQETHQRLEATFTEVNTTFQEVFPRLFGGGHASLELTCDNLLEAGVLVRAQPPGKRNNIIHLLSGGEKAMTAVALIFAIFKLNPSPFCMLDEVDAPLDEVNIQRFCDLVKEMSPSVQFLFITHNKLTMELAEQLIGVTMREPGVSRIVAVDVEQALALTET